MGSIYQVSNTIKRQYIGEIMNYASFPCLAIIKQNSIIDTSLHDVLRLRLWGDVRTSDVYPDPLFYSRYIKMC